jgi:hypothetical protein
MKATFQGHLSLYLIILTRYINNVRYRENAPMWFDRHLQVKLQGMTRNFKESKTRNKR